jgi:transposase InsO family protein
VDGSTDGRSISLGHNTKVSAERPGLNLRRLFPEAPQNIGITEVIIAPRRPWQNPFVERLIGSIRRDCLDHVIVLNANHLKRILTSNFEYYHCDRTHYGLGKDTPVERPIQPRPTKGGKVIDFPCVGWLHHRYEWRKAA